MVEASVNDSHPGVPDDPPKSDAKQQKLLKCVLTGNSKQCLSKSHTEERVNKLSVEEVHKLVGNYETKLSVQIVKSLGKSIIRMYSIGSLCHFRNEQSGCVK